MPTFTTPTPIDLAIDLQVGRIDVIASDRADTVVTVTASSPEKAIDRRGAEETKVDFDGQRVVVTGPRPRLSWIGSGPSDSVDVKVELPTASRFTAEIAVGGVRATGRLGATRIKSSTGAVDAETTGDLWLRVSHGNVTVGAVEGGMEVTSSYGQVRVGTVTGDAIIKASYGNILIGETRGELDAKLSYGDLEITKALSSVAAKTAYGSIELHEVSSGSIQIESGYGQIRVGVRPGVPAWLDVASKIGTVRNDLTGDGTPAPSEQTVSVRARTQGGDIDIQRAS